MYFLISIKRKGGFLKNKNCNNNDKNNKIPNIYIKPFELFSIHVCRFRNDTSVFSKLSQQCAQLSITESYLFDHFPDNNMIRFSSLSEPKFEELRSIVFKSSTVCIYLNKQ